MAGKPGQNAGLSEDAPHFGAGKAVDGKEADGPEDDEDQAQGCCFIHRAADIKIEDAHGHHFMTGNDEKQGC